MYFSVLVLMTALLVNAAPIPLDTKPYDLRAHHDAMSAPIALARRAVLEEPSPVISDGTTPTVTVSSLVPSPSSVTGEDPDEECEDGEEDPAEDDPTAPVEEPTPTEPSTGDPSSEPTSSQPPADTPKSGSEGGGFLVKNGQSAKQQNEAFAGLTVNSSCKEGETACVEGGFAQCLGEKWVIQKCSGGLTCAALPLINSEGTSVTCTTEADRDARIASALAG